MPFSGRPGERACICRRTLQLCGNRRQVTRAVGSRTKAAKLRASTRVSDSPSPPAAYATRSPDQVAARPRCSRRSAVSECNRYFQSSGLSCRDMYSHSTRLLPCGACWNGR